MSNGTIAPDCNSPAKDLIGVLVTATRWKPRSHSAFSRLPQASFISTAHTHSWLDEPVEGATHLYHQLPPQSHIDTSLCVFTAPTKVFRDHTLVFFQALITKEKQPCRTQFLSMVISSQSCFSACTSVQPRVTTHLLL